MNYLHIANRQLEAFAKDPVEFIDEHDPLQFCTRLHGGHAASLDDVISATIASIATYGMPALQLLDREGVISLAAKGTREGMMLSTSNYRRSRIIDLDLDSPPDLMKLMWENFTIDRRLTLLTGVPQSIWLEILRFLPVSRAIALLVSIFDRLQGAMSE